jgi:hypothetical protein
VGCPRRSTLGRLRSLAVPLLAASFVWADTADEARLRWGSALVNEQGNPQEMQLSIELRFSSFPIVSRVRLFSRGGLNAPWMEKELVRDAQGAYPVLLPYAPSLQYYLTIVTERGEALSICTEARPCEWDTSRLPRMRQPSGRGKARALKAGGGILGGTLAALLAVVTAGAGGGGPPRESPLTGSWVGQGVDGLVLESSMPAACSSRSVLAIAFQQTGGNLGGRLRITATSGNCLPPGTTLESELSGTITGNSVVFTVGGPMTFSGGLSGMRLSGFVDGVLPAPYGFAVRGQWSAVREGSSP